MIAINLATPKAAPKRELLFNKPTSRSFSLSIDVYRVYRGLWFIYHFTTELRWLAWLFHVSDKKILGFSRTGCVFTKLCTKDSFSILMVPDFPRKSKEKKL